MGNRIQLISPGKQNLLKVLLMDKRINSLVLLHDEIPESIEIADDGSVTFGRTKRKWWNHIFADKTTLDFDTLCLRMMVAYKKYTPPNTGFSIALTKEIIENLLENKAYDSIIDKFVFHALIGVTEGDYKNQNLQYVDGDNNRDNNSQACRNNKKPNKKVTQGTVYVDIGGGVLPVTVDIEQLTLKSKYFFHFDNI